MTLHLVKLAVGVEDVPSFESWLALHLREVRARGERAVYRHVTRRMPRRAPELLDGGSLFWVVSGAIRARQRLLAFETQEKEGKSYCAIVLEGTLVPTRAKQHRPFQGWRYLPADDAPPDAEGGGQEILPPELAAALQELGLI